MNPPRFCKRSEEEISFDIRAIMSKQTWIMFPFLTMWLSGWTFGCVLILKNALEGEKFLWLFGIPFWVAEIGVGGFLLYTLFYHAKLTLNQEGLTYRVWGLLPKKRFVAWHDLKKITSREIEKRGKESVQRYRTLLVILQDGSEISISATSYVDEATTRWLEHEMNDFLTGRRNFTQYNGFTLWDTEDTENSQLEELESDEYDEDLETDVFESYPADGRISYISQPENSEWTRSEEFSPFEVSRTKQFQVSKLFGALFVYLFWNGIVSVFVFTLWFGEMTQIDGAPPFGTLAWWGMFAFLIPFELIGLCLLGNVLSELFPRAVRETLIFERGIITQRTSWFGFPKTRTITLDSIMVYQITYGGSGKYDLQFITENDDSYGEISALTLADAHWLLSKYRQIVGL